MRFLVFQLYGPLVSWGDTAVGERRPTTTAPSRSGVLGLLAGALGIRRDDEEALAKIQREYSVAFRVEEPGMLLTDYHTAQVAPAHRGVAPQTRAGELRADDLHTVLSTREYRCDALSVACIWTDAASPPWSLEAIAEALRRPSFTSYLGRKACVPALPFRPAVVEGSDAVEALRNAKTDEEFLACLPRGKRRTYHWEGARGPATQTIRRRDEALSRKQWQFGEREEHMLIEERGRVP